MGCKKKVWANSILSPISAVVVLSRKEKKKTDQKPPPPQFCVILCLKESKNSSEVNN